MGLQSCKSPNFWILGLQLDIWVLAQWPGIENTIRGRWWLSSSPGCGEFYESCESMFAHGSSIHQKWSNYALTNLFDLCRSMWVIDLLITLPSHHLGAPARPSTPKVLRARECAPTPCPSVIFTLWTHIWIHQGVGGASISVIGLVITSYIVTTGSTGVTSSITTLTLGLWLIVKCTSPWSQEYVSMWNTLTNGGDARDEAEWLPSALPLWELHSWGNCKCLEPWLERKTNTKLGLEDTIKFWSVNS
jgi:hypothetical protein